MTVGDRPYAGRSSEERHRDRRERLLQGALELVGEGGYPALTVRAICTHAGLTPRYFYAEFGTVEALARRLFDREFDVGIARVAAAVAAAGPDTARRLDAAVGAVLDVLTEVPARSALLLADASGADVLATRRRERMDDVVALLAAMGTATYGDDDGPRDAAAAAAGERAVRIASTFVAAGLTQTVDAWVRGHVDATREELQGALAAQIAAVGDAAFARLEQTLRAGPDASPSI